MSTHSLDALNLKLVDIFQKGSQFLDSIRGCVMKESFLYQNFYFHHPVSSKDWDLHETVSIFIFMILYPRYDINLESFLYIFFIFSSCIFKRLISPWNSQHFYFHDLVSLIRYQLESQLQIKYLWNLGIEFFIFEWYMNNGLWGNTLS